MSSEGMPEWWTWRPKVSSHITSIRRARHTLFWPVKIGSHEVCATSQLSLASSACCTSANKSSRSSSPMDNRTVPSVTPEIVA